MKHLAINNVSKSFDGRTVLQNISFDVKEGEFVSIIGPSGSGKSTLFNLIGGLLHPDAGNILFDGKVITGQSGHIAYMPQNPSLFPWRTIVENAVLGQELSGKIHLEQARKLLEKARLGNMMDAYPHQLSGGMKQRVAFIRALLSPQSFMCLDEPFSALDALTRIDMQNWLLETWTTYEKSILFITHDIEEAIFLSDKIVVLSSNPAEVKHIFPVPFERPRDDSIRLHDDFLVLKKQLMEQIIL